METTESIYKVPLTKVLEIKPHNNAEKLEIAVVYGFEVVVKKDWLKVGDLVFYVPIDSLIPVELENHLFPPGSKVTLKNSRIRQIRLRGVVSQGLLISPGEMSSVYGSMKLVLEKDYSEILRIIKYSPPEPEFQGTPGTPGSRKQMENKFFTCYNGLTNIKWCPEFFKTNEVVVYTEKIHGSNSRAGLLPFTANTLWKKILKFLNLAPKYEFCFGSNRVQLQNKFHYKGFYEENIYKQILVDELDMKSRLKPGETVYGEIYGPGIQKNYTYGLTEKKFILFDVKLSSPDGNFRWLDFDEVIEFGKERGLEVVPVLYRGPFYLAHAKELASGPSVLCPTQKVREGIVIKSMEQYNDERGNKRALKVINPDYLDDSSNTDFN